MENKQIFFIFKNIEKRIYRKRLNKFAFMVVGFNFQNFVVVPIIEWLSSTACLDKLVKLLSSFVTSLMRSCFRVIN